MITPVFEITQDDIFIYICVRAPYSKVTDAEVFVEDEDFKFYAKPYFLRLHLPAPLIDDERASCDYEVDGGQYKIKIAKLNTGTHFEDLDMLTKLLTPVGERSTKKPLIQVLTDDSKEMPEVCNIDEDFDWFFPQGYDPQETPCVSGCGYGFANQKCGVFAKIQQDMHDVLQIKNLENSTLESRRKERLHHEDDKFDPDHYLADLFEDQEIKELLKISPPWCNVSSTEGFTEKERIALKDLPNCEYLLDKSELKKVYLGLVDILFSYAYNWRTTEGDYSTESAWNIRTLSYTLAWCDSCWDIRTAICFCYRRCLAYPLHRNWELAESCREDVAEIFQRGKKFMLRCLLDIHDLFKKNDPYYLLNDIYITDYCVWIQKASISTIKSLGDALSELKITKADVGFELVELEEAAHLVLQEEERIPRDSSCQEQSPDAYDVIDKIEELTI